MQVISLPGGGVSPRGSGAGVPADAPGAGPGIRVPPSGVESPCWVEPRLAWVEVPSLVVVVVEVDPSSLVVDPSLVVVGPAKLGWVDAAGVLG